MLSDPKGIWADPYLWASAAAVFAGLAAGQAARALIFARGGESRTTRRRSRRIARATSFLSLGILAFAALLVFADKTALGPELILWVALIAVLAVAAGCRPLSAGLPLVFVALAALAMLRLSLEGWLPLRPAAAGASVKIAALLAYDVGPSSFRGHLELPVRDSVPIAQELGLASSSAALSVESLELWGPLGFAVSIAAPQARPDFAPMTRFYRIVGVAAPGGIFQKFASPVHVLFLDAVLPLPAAAGIEPGGGAVSRQAVFGLARRSRRTSAAAPLIALEPLSFGLDEDGVISIERN
jgi:hypothetical protein